MDRRQQLYTLGTLRKILIFFLCPFVLNAQRAHPLSSAIPKTVQQWIIKTSPHEGGLVIGSLAGFVNGEYMDGNLAQYDILWFFATYAQANSTVPFINFAGAGNITNVNSTTWTALKGYKGNQSTMYLNTNFPASAGSHFTQNNGSFGDYRYSAPVSPNSDNDIAFDGQGAGKAVCTIYNNGSSATQLSYYINVYTPAAITNTLSNTLSLNACWRTNSASAGFYNRGVAQGTTSATTSALPAYNWFIMANNNNGSPVGQGGFGISMGFVGSGAINLSAQYNNFQNRVAIPIGFNQ